MGSEMQPTILIGQYIAVFLQNHCLLRRHNCLLRFCSQEQCCNGVTALAGHFSGIYNRIGRNQCTGIHNHVDNFDIFITFHVLRPIAGLRITSKFNLHDTLVNISYRGDFQCFRQLLRGGFKECQSPLNETVITNLRGRFQSFLYTNNKYKFKMIKSNSR